MGDGSSLPEHPYPVTVDVRGRLAVVVGGGAVAARKIGTLLRCGARVVVIGPELDARIDRTRVDWREKLYKSGDISVFGPDMPFIVLACTDDDGVNVRIVDDARAAGVPLINNVGDPAQSSFFNVAVVETDECLFTVSTRGRDPGMARRLKQRLLRWLQGEVGA